MFTRRPTDIGMVPVAARAIVTMNIATIAARRTTVGIAMVGRVTSRWNSSSESTMYP
ncbi:MAG: hypothetical protein H0T88_11760 [Lysobacter sp.]|nr:hypothetical protein [Lysobacter sp.]